MKINGKHYRSVWPIGDDAFGIIDLPDLGGADKLRKLGVPVRTLVAFEGH